MTSMDSLEKYIPLSSSLHELFNCKQMIALLDKEHPDLNDSKKLLWLLSSKEYSVGLITEKVSFLPYLSVQENLFLGTSIKKRNQKNQLQELFSLTNLDLFLLNKSIDALSSFENLKLQVIQFLLLEKKLLIIDNSFKQLSVKECQSFLSILQHLTKLKNITVLLVTNDQQIVQSSYISKVVTEINN